MSIIMDALEKAQRDRERQSGELSEESLLHPATSAQKGESRSWGKVVSYIVIGNVILILLLGGGALFLRKKDQHFLNDNSTVIKKAVEREHVEIVAENEIAVPVDRSVERTNLSKPLYVKELTLDNGLKIRVDGVYLDDNIPYALIGPDIVKSGDTIEGLVVIKQIDFKKVEIEYQGRKYFLLAE